MTLGEKIQKLRKQRGLSQEALAEKVTVTRQTISKWELGQSTPDLDFIAQLSDIFNVSSDYLISGFWLTWNGSILTLQSRFVSVAYRLGHCSPSILLFVMGIK